METSMPRVPPQDENICLFNIVRPKCQERARFVFDSRFRAVKNILSKL